LLLAATAVLSGCGTTKSRTATEQLLMSDAVDRTIAQIDFRPLAGQTVFLDTEYIKNVKGFGFVNADYVISAIRQQMTAAGCLLETNREDAAFVVEGRMGALGTDGHEVTYGIPANTGLAEAAALVSNAPAVPLIPEISVAKKEDMMGAAKIALFAYHRESRQPVWQSGVAIATNNAKDAWICGAGPFQFGTIYEGTQFAGSRLQVPLIGKELKPREQRQLVSYYEEVDFGTVSKLDERAQPLLPEQFEAELQALGHPPPMFPLTQQMLAGPETGGAAAPDGSTAPAGPGASDPNAAAAASETVAERPEGAAPPEKQPGALR
jgi:hypothetical protein